MFTGIIQEQGAIKNVQRRSGGVRLCIQRPRRWKRLGLGSSIAVDGVCLTLSGFTQRTMCFDVMAQTVRLTTLGSLRVGSAVNLERALKASDSIGGHFMLGHVDAVATVMDITKQPNDYYLTVRLPRSSVKFCPGRGSIAMNGVSLTIARQRGTELTVALAPYTIQNTNLGLLKNGSRVNVEVDVIARYVLAQVSGIRYIDGDVHI